MTQNDLNFDGPCYDPALDRERLTGQCRRVYNVMLQGYWFTLDEIANMTGDPHASVSAQLRHLRKLRFGSFCIEKRRRGYPGKGVWEYKLIKGEI